MADEIEKEELDTEQDIEFDENEVKDEKKENRHTRGRYLISLIILAFVGINGFLLFTDPPAVKEMYDYNGKVEMARVKLSEYKENIDPNDQKKYDNENHQLEIRLKEKQQEVKLEEQVVEIAKHEEEEMTKKVTELTTIKDGKNIEKYVEALNNAKYAAVSVQALQEQRAAFESQAEKGGASSGKK